MSTSDIDKNHIVTLKEEAGKFYNVNVPIEKPEQFIAELSAMVDNPNRTVWDMQSLFQSRYPNVTRYIDYIYPHSYSASYVSGTEYPSMRGYEDLRKSWSETAQKVAVEYSQKCITDGVQENANILVSIVETSIANLKLQQKKNFLQKALKWIDACCYQEAANKADRSSSIKMYSKENIGWNTFNHRISKDINVELRTNFGYGSAAYFLLGVKYKGIAILPYSYIVKYYKAGMADIVRCTRSYAASRDSWCASFDFLSDFINSSANDPESFVKSYILREVEEMMQGLEAIARNPKMYMEKIGNVKADPCVVNVRPMFADEKKRMAAYPSETPILFKVEKITGALDFLKSLTEISQEVEIIQKYINKLMELNLSLLPEIEDTTIKISLKIDEWTQRKELLQSKIDVVDEKLRPYEEEIQKAHQALSPNQYFSMAEYESVHKEYKNLKTEKSDLCSARSKAIQAINDFTSFKRLLNCSLDKINEIKMVSDAA
ncbi:MAG: hypothetical protein NC453_21665 [Muribaculum sp.]|nr:hypothetical protein [Muribaculum sp.]